MIDEATKCEISDSERGSSVYANKLIKLIIVVLLAQFGSISQGASVMTYDGVYVGTGVSDPSNTDRTCTAPVPQRLTVKNGVASLGQNDPRNGSVNADGSLTMTGVWKGIPLKVEGKISNSTYAAVSSYGNPPMCKYNWSLRKE
jgi:hypothetical protein